MRSRRLAALLLACCVLGVLACSLGARRQLGTLAGLTDEWIMLGANLAVHGTLGLDDEPWLLRPPGYPAFIAAPLVLAGPPRAVTMAYLGRAEGLVYASQALALALAAVVTFLWLSRSLGPWTAFAAGLTLALNPLSVALVGLLQYGVVHVLGIVAGLWLLDRALATWPDRRGPLLVAGAAWGLVTLVRPVSLLLPPFIFLACLAGRRRPGLRGAAAAALAFTLTAAAVIAPWTARNYALSGRLIPVNLQGWANVWAATLRPLPIDVDSYRWGALGPDILRIQKQVSGQDGYDLLTYVRLNAEFEAAYRRDAIAHLRSQPGVYALNAARSLWTIATGTSTVVLGAFRALQAPGLALRAEWFQPGAANPFDAAALRAAVRWLYAVLGVFALVGLVVALRRREGPAWGATAVAAAFALTHALTHLEFTYLYVRLPFLVVLGFTGTAALSRLPRLVVGRWRLDPGDLAASLVALGSLALTAALLR